MILQRIRVTEAARRFSDMIARVRYQNAGFLLLKGGEPVAQVIPWEEQPCTGRELADIIAGVQLTESERRSWREDLHRAKRVLNPPVARWR